MGKKAGHPIYLVEDAAYRELGFRPADAPSSLALPEAADRIVLAGTYSKPFATGLRVGFGLLPEPLLLSVLRLKSNHDFGTANLLQAILARGLATGVYDHHLQRLRRRYRTKAGWMLRALKTLFPASVQWQQPTGGLYVWTSLPRGVRTGPRSALFEHALQHKVLYVPGCYCYPKERRRRPPDHEMRLSFGNATRPQIETGIERLAAALRQML